MLGKHLSGVVLGVKKSGVHYFAREFDNRRLHEEFGLDAAAVHDSGESGELPEAGEGQGEFEVVLADVFWGEFDLEFEGLLGFYLDVVDFWLGDGQVVVDGGLLVAVHVLAADSVVVFVVFVVVVFVRAFHDCFVAWELIKDCYCRRGIGL